MKKILITGGTGLLGKEIVKGFLKKKKKLYILLPRQSQKAKIF